MTLGGGIQIDGYSNLVKVAKGGFGTVFRGTQDRFGREVALKVLDTEELDEKGRRRFERECLAMGSLSWHPGVVAVFDSGITDDRQPYLVMEYLDAGSLGDRLKLGPMGWPEVLRVGVQVAGALEAAHRAGTLHRDLKPENILIGPFGEAKLADFGIAAIQGSTRTTVGHASFTVAHVAPEVLRGQRPDERSDVYGLATTLYTLVAGVPPFAGDPAEPFVATMARIVNEPAHRLDGVPAPFADLLQAALAKDPDQRPRTALELGESLQGVQVFAGEPVTELQVARTSAQGARHLSAGSVGDPDVTPAQARTGDARPTVHVPVNRTTQGPGAVVTADQAMAAESVGAPPGIPTATTEAQATATQVGASAGGVELAWWLPGLVGVAVIAGAFSPFVSTDGSTTRLAEPVESVASYVALGALLVLASAVSRGSRLGIALGGGAALTFVVSYVGVLRGTLGMFNGADALGVEAVPQVGFFVWGAAAIGSAAIVILALTSLMGPTPRRWPFVFGAVGFALLLVGLVVPRAGLGVGEHLFAGDGWSDAAVLLLLASVALVAVLLAVRPTSPVAAFATGAGCPWFVSWAVFAFTGAPGGLPVPFPEAALVAGLAFGLMSATVAGALWWSPSALASTTGGTLTGARVAVIVLCGATSAVAIGGTAAADNAAFAGFEASNVAPSLDYVVVASDVSTSGVTATSEGGAEGIVTTTGPTTSVVVSTTTALGPETAVARCVEVFCRSHPELSPVVDELIDQSRTRDLALVGTGQWIAQVQANAVTSSDAQLREAYAALAAQVPDLRVAYSNDFASMPSGYVIFFNAGPFASGEDAVSYCFDVGRGDRDLCFGRFMSDDPADGDAYVFP